MEETTEVVIPLIRKIMKNNNHNNLFLFASSYKGNEIKLTQQWKNNNNKL